LTGSYHNYFRIYDVKGDNDVVLQADKSAFKAKKMARGKTPGKSAGLQTDDIDFTKKIVSIASLQIVSPLTSQLHASWHPHENTIAVSIEPVLRWSRG
jgi:serine/threonine-protein phosphatase 2A regulatory subunit B